MIYLCIKNPIYRLSYPSTLSKSSNSFENIDIYILVIVIGLGNLKVTILIYLALLKNQYKELLYYYIIINITY